MKPLNKWLILTYFLALIAIVECAIVVYDIFFPQRGEFALATAEIDVPERIVKIQPLLFEEHSAQKIAADLDEFMAGYKKRTMVLQQLTSGKNENIALNPEPKADVSALDEKYIAVVIDDMGISPKYTKEIIDLKKPFTASFLPYAPANMAQVNQAKEAGFEVMLHVPMMPHKRAYLAPITLSPEMDKATVQKHLENFLAYFSGSDMRGVNNHMGSEFTENAQSLAYVMEILKQKNMFFLDTKTTGKSAVKQIAEKYGVPYIGRDVFLDNENDYNYVMGQLRQTEKIAAKHGYAVAIGHPHEQTARALSDWLKDVENRGFKLVHISDLLQKTQQ